MFIEHEAHLWDGPSENQRLNTFHRSPPNEPDARIGV